MEKVAKVFRRCSFFNKIFNYGLEKLSLSDKVLEHSSFAILFKRSSGTTDNVLFCEKFLPLVY